MVAHYSDPLRRTSAWRLSKEQLKTLTDRARRVRIDILKMLTECGSGHTGGSLSAADIATALYFYKMKYDREEAGLEGT